MDKEDLRHARVGFIGGGNMASAIGASLIRKGILNPDNVWVSARTNRTLDFWNNLGAHATLSNGDVVEHCDIIFLAIKPQMLDEALHGLRNTLTQKLNESKLYVSVLAGVTIETLHQKLSAIVADPRIIRSLPSTPMIVGEGITIYSCKNTTHKDELMIDTMLSHIGISENVSENLINAIGGLSGSGPAYAYLIIEALADGAVKMGVPRPMATKFAAQVLVGAGKMVLETGRHPGQLKDEVCSAGGTTITGVHEMEIGHVRASMMNAVQAAVRKSEEMATKFQSAPSKP